MKKLTQQNKKKFKKPRKCKPKKNKKGIEEFIKKCFNIPVNKAYLDMEVLEKEKKKQLTAKIKLLQTD